MHIWMAWEERETEEKAQREAEEQAQREAEEKARKEAEDQAEREPDQNTSTFAESRMKGWQMES